MTTAITCLHFTPALHVSKVHDDNMSCRARHKQRLIATVENDTLNAELRVVTQRVVAADLKRTTTA